MMEDSVNKPVFRDSNIELARIVAMMMILALHAFNPCFWNSLSNKPCVPDVVIILGEAINGCAVGLFAFISGWYRIKPKTRSCLNLIFQVVFYGFIVFLIDSLSHGNISTKGIKDMFLLSNSLWFIKSYFLLYILSPVLNAFVENVDKKNFRFLLIAFFLFQTVYGWTNTAVEFNYGLSVVFLAFMYLLACYMRLYPNKLANRTGAFLYLGVFLASAGLSALTIYIKHYYGFVPLTEEMLLSYVNPLMVLCSVNLFLFFSKLRFKSKTVNWISASCLSVYLIHANTIVAPYYRNLAWNEFLNGKYLLFIATIFGVFLVCVVIDQIRRIIYNNTFGRIPFH